VAYFSDLRWIRCLISVLDRLHGGSKLLISTGLMLLISVPAFVLDWFLLDGFWRIDVADFGAWINYVALWFFYSKRKDYIRTASLSRLGEYGKIRYPDFTNRQQKILLMVTMGGWIYIRHNVCLFFAVAPSLSGQIGRAVRPNWLNSGWFWWINVAYFFDLGWIRCLMDYVADQCCWFLLD